MSAKNVISWDLNFGVHLLLIKGLLETTNILLYCQNIFVRRVTDISVTRQLGFSHIFICYDALFLFLQTGSVEV